MQQVKKESLHPLKIVNKLTSKTYPLEGILIIYILILKIRAKISKKSKKSCKI